MTHLFWPHRQIGQDRLPDHPHVRLWPFPCAPCPLADSLPHRTERSRLYTYAGIDSQHLSPAREPDPILYQPTTDRAGLVVTPPQAGISPPTLESSWWNGSPVSIEALRIMHSSTFSLCPEANSSWLWTSVASEAIPVFFEKMPPLPGNRSLWEEATVCCPAGREAVLELPGRLENLARSDDLLEIKRRALRQLRLLYGADCFIYDILKLFVSLAGTSAGKITARAGLPYGPLHGLAAQIIQGSESGRSCANIFTLGCGSRVLADSSAFLMHYQRDDQFRLACQKAFAVCDEYPRELLRQALALKNLELDDCDAIKSTGGTTPC